MPGPTKNYESVATDSLHTDGQPDAIVWREGDTYYAGGRDGEIDQGTQAHTVINSAIDPLSTGTGARQHIDVIGDIAMSGSIVIESRTLLNLQNASLEVQSDFPSDTPLIDGTGGIEHAIVYGGELLGNKANAVSGIQAIKWNDASSTVWGAGGHNKILHTNVAEFTGTGVVSNSRRDLLFNMEIRRCDVNGVQLSGTDIKAIDCYSGGHAQSAWYVIRPHCHLISCTGEGSKFGLASLADGTKSGNHTFVLGGFYENNDDYGIYLRDSAECLIAPFEVIANGQSGDTNDEAIYVEGACANNWFKNIDIHDPNGTPTQGDAMFIESTPTDNIIQDVQTHNNPSGITDNAARTIENGRSYQSAAPGSGNTGDEWGGNEARAEKFDVTVIDDSVTQPYNIYKADGAANWVQVG